MLQTLWRRETNGYTRIARGCAPFGIMRRAAPRIPCANNHQSHCRVSRTLRDFLQRITPLAFAESSRSQRRNRVSRARWHHVC